MKLPNRVTIIRFFLIPFILVLLYSTNPVNILWSIFFFFIAILTDWYDGYSARKYKLKSVFGTFFDPIVDKMLVLSIFLVFVDLELVPLWLILLLLFREFLVSGMRKVCSSSKKIVGANWMGKSKFVIQTIIIFYVQIFLYLNYTGWSLAFFNKSVIYYSTIVMVLVSLVYILNFAYWHKKELFSDI